MRQCCIEQNTWDSGGTARRQIKFPRGQIKCEEKQNGTISLSFPGEIFSLGGRKEICTCVQVN